MELAPIGVEAMEMLTDTEISNLIKVSRRQIWKLLAMGRLPEPIRIGRSVRWRRADIDSWIANGCKVQPASKRAAP